jgi:hypothetical protein
MNTFTVNTNKGYLIEDYDEIRRYIKSAPGTLTGERIYSFTPDYKQATQFQTYEGATASIRGVKAFNKYLDVEVI